MGKSIGSIHSLSVSHETDVNKRLYFYYIRAHRQVVRSKTENHFHVRRLHVRRVKNAINTNARHIGNERRAFLFPVCINQSGAFEKVYHARRIQGFVEIAAEKYGARRVTQNGKASRRLRVAFLLAQPPVRAKDRKARHPASIPQRHFQQAALLFSSGQQMFALPGNRTAHTNAQPISAPSER